MKLAEMPFKTVFHWVFNPPIGHFFLVDRFSFLLCAFDLFIRSRLAEVLWSSPFLSLTFQGPGVEPGVSRWGLLVGLPFFPLTAPVYVTPCIFRPLSFSTPRSEPGKEIFAFSNRS